MTFSPEFAEKRFGYGLSPRVAPVQSLGQMLEGVGEADPQVDAFPIEAFDAFLSRVLTAERARKMAKLVGRDTVEGKEFLKQARVAGSHARKAKATWFLNTQLRRAYTEQGFKERLIAFWGDHFSAQGKQGVIRQGTSSYLEGAIRPHVAGRFADLLIAAVTHPLMLHYLDQQRSMGPDSTQAIKRKRKTGLNENLAREVIELHTLGVGGPYTQTDVRQLAELFTGLSYESKTGFRFRKDFVEPGAETVLGRTYGPDPGLGQIHQVLEDLAVHPATAAHVARKLAVHFVSDQPDDGLVQHVTAAYRATGGDLMAVYGALLEHPAAWQVTEMNAKQPEEFISSALRALAVTPRHLSGPGEREVFRLFFRPLRLMGQLYQRPSGPDGWPEEDSAWITPQGIAARLEWSMQTPRRLFRTLPDPRDFVHHALGEVVPHTVHFATMAAERRHEAIGLILSSPAFQRR